MNDILNRLRTEVANCAIGGAGVEREIAGQVMIEAITEIERLRELVTIGAAVVDDFLPDIGKCCLQDYGRLNDFLIRASKVEMKVPTDEL